MQFYSSLDEIPSDFGPSAITFGKFDGIHVGHRRVIDELRAVAEERGLVSTVLTFDRNPLSLLAPDRCPESIVSNAQKRELIESAGIGAMVELTFDREFSAQRAEEFVERIIVGTLHAAVVLVGPDTRFGAGGLGTYETLVELGRAGGFEVMRLEPYLDESDRPASSSRVRELLAAGDVAAAGKLLGRNPSVRSVVVQGQHRGRALGFPTANLSPELEGFIPADGVYAGYLTVDERRMPAAISIGNNPTFEGVPERQVEAHVLDEDLDLYDKTVEVQFVERIRGMEKFATLDELIEGIRRDTERAREVLSAG